MEELLVPARVTRRSTGRQVTGDTGDCLAVSEFTVQIHPPVLPPGDAYIPDERVENLQRLREENFVYRFQDECLSQILTRLCRATADTQAHSRRHLTTLWT
ncbi:hypothetical protein KIN20_020764 [Parelaphostrongylus tenuis]|uniref:Uncharacterized protein n=1 Tax=Parelaphostrongylus tenuis TaxID=148309 RepID=A0AAD5QR30_PARTN|nr:hypothetical protein KIN20_020764 [Parelaphostrongylus tenuis]